MKGIGDYIFRDAAIEAMYKDAEVHPGNTFLATQFAALCNIPAADVVEVVRCKNCKMANSCSDDREMYCTVNHCYKGNNYFCADGRRKNENPY